MVPVQAADKIGKVAARAPRKGIGDPDALLIVRDMIAVKLVKTPTA